MDPCTPTIGLGLGLNVTDAGLIAAEAVTSVHSACPVSTLASSSLKATAPERYGLLYLLQVI